MNTAAIGDADTVTIVGAGLAGSLLAVYLARRGFRVELFERGPDPRHDELPGGRSINLALAERGIHALEQVGLHRAVAKYALPMRGRMIHDRAGGQTLQPYGLDPREVIYSVHRQRLSATLLEAAGAAGNVRVRFDRELKSLDLGSGEGTFVDTASGRETTRPVVPLIGADGAGSVVRAALERALGFRTGIEFLDHGYQELTIPAGPAGRHRLAPDALHIWPRAEFMMIALPNDDGSFTATLFLARTAPAGQPSFAALEQPAAFRAFCAEQFPDLEPLLERIDEEHAAHPIGELGTVRCPHWQHAGRAVLIGDAAHAVVPFHGQGMNCAFEDCLELDRAIAAEPTWEGAFARFEAARLQQAAAIADMALENYLEMRSSVADPGYRLRLELSRELERRHPRRFVPRYALVMFRRLPYREAQLRGEINRRILEQLTEGAERLDQVDFERARGLIESQLEPLDPTEGPIVL